jgi:hypothetical protein
MMLSRTPDAVRNVAFENCGGVKPFNENVSLPSCDWYFAKYNAAYWGGAPFKDLLMMRDVDDAGQPNPGSDTMPLINFKKEGLFDPTQPLFPDMVAGNYEEWTVSNHSFRNNGAGEQRPSSRKDRATKPNRRRLSAKLGIFRV